MNDALCPLSRKVVSAKAARPKGAGSATGTKPLSCSSADMRPPPELSAHRSVRCISPGWFVPRSVRLETGQRLPGEALPTARFRSGRPGNDKRMSHTTTNLREVENAAPKFDMPDAMEARFARSDLQGETL